MNIYDSIICSNFRMPFLSNKSAAQVKKCRGPSNINKDENFNTVTYDKTQQKLTVQV